MNPDLERLQSYPFQKHPTPEFIMFSSLSKRSNVPGMRSGFVAGDAAILQKFLLYRTYHGCAMSPPIHAASIYVTLIFGGFRVSSLSGPSSKDC